MCGLTIQISPDRPKMQLSERVCEVLAPDFIAETNAWMLGFFGIYNLVPDGQAYQTGHTVIVNPRTYAALRAATPPPQAQGQQQGEAKP